MNSSVDDFPSYTVTLHEDEVRYLRVGEGPVLVLIHGIGGTAQSWKRLLSLLQQDFTVIAPDLFFGHTNAAKRGDYTLGDHAGRLRDLLDLLGVRRATLVGHSLGGGVALQFAWLFRERCEGLVPVSSGGFGHELSLVLRLLTLPGAEWVLQLISSPWLLRRGEWLVGRLGPVQKLLRGYASLGDAAARRAFLATLRTVVDLGGQKVSALERLPALAGIPTLLVWGAADPVIPAAHGRTAQQRLPGSRLELFDTDSHAPHLKDPLRFAALLREFAAATPVGERVDRRHPPRQAGRLQAVHPEPTTTAS
jgi:pimeloyl-ACP methyl ester carboxylesterase